MIKVEKMLFGSNVSVEGNKDTLASEFKCLVKGFIEHNTFTAEELHELIDEAVDGDYGNVELGGKSAKEAVNAIIQEILDTVFNDNTDNTEGEDK